MWRFYYTIGRNMLRLPGIIASMRHRVDHPEQYSEEECYEYARYVVNLMQKTGHIKTQGFGMENLPKQGGYMLYPNHQGKYDAYGIVAVHEKPCTVVMDKAKSYIIFIRELIDLLKAKRMDIHDTRQALGIIKEVAAEVAQGRRYILFPEGGYAKNQKNRLGDFKAGCFKIVLESKAPIVLVALIDSWKVFNSWQLLPVTTQVHFLEPIYYEEYKDLKTVQIAELVKTRIQQKIDEVCGASSQDCRKSGKNGTDK